MPPKFLDFLYNYTTCNKQRLLTVARCESVVTTVEHHHQPDWPQTLDFPPPAQPKHSILATLYVGGFKSWFWEDFVP